jgi:hypothetical protein
MIAGGDFQPREGDANPDKNWSAQTVPKFMCQGGIFAAGMIALRKGNSTHEFVIES